MDLTTLLPAALGAVVSLVSAYLGHTATLSSIVKHFNLGNLNADLVAAQKALAAVQTVTKALDSAPVSKELVAAAKEAEKSPK